ncbi:MAG: hypothetical protein HY343_00840 [Lentisphaerae bacterium]|nr:hypothetical protein [Lentisphaerota bacterium]
MKINIPILAALVLAHVASASAGMIVTNPVETVRGTLPREWTILRVETNTYPFYRPKGNGTSIFLGLQGKKYLKQDFSAVLYIMPSEYEDGGEDPTGGQAQSWPPRLIATTDKAKVYLWPGPQSEEWKTMQRDILTALMKNNEEQRTMGARVPELFTKIEVGMDRTSVESVLGKPTMPALSEGQTIWYLPAPTIAAHASPYAPGSIGIVYDRNGKVTKKELNPQI